MSFVDAFIVFLFPVLALCCVVAMIGNDLSKQEEKRRRCIARLAAEHHLTDTLTEDALRVFDGQFPTLEATQLWNEALVSGKSTAEWHAAFRAFVKQRSAKNEVCLA
jgi:hypothetical protein